MNKEQETSDIKESDLEEVQTEIKKMNRKWYENPFYFIGSLILGPATFIGGFFIDFNTVWQSALQAVLFVISAGFFVLLLSYVFNLTWIYSNKEKSYKNYLIHGFLQLGVLIALIVIFVLNAPHSTAEILENTTVFRTLAIVYQSLIFILSITTLLSFVKVWNTDWMRSEISTFALIGSLSGAVLGSIVFVSLYFMTKYAVRFVF